MYRLALALFVMTTTALAGVFHVSPTGSDQNPGTLESPLSTLDKAATLAQAGDTVILHAGTYPIAKEIRFRNSGAEGAWITYRAADGERVVLDASLENMRKDAPRAGYVGVIDVAGVSWLRFIGLEIRNAWSFAFRIGGDNTHHIEILNCRVNRSYCPGVWLGKSENCRVIGCDITNTNDIDARLPGTRRPNEAPHEALSIAQARNFEVALNHVHHCYKEGIDCKETSSHGIIHDNLVDNCARQGLYVDCWFGALQDVEIANNISHDNEWGIAVSAEGKRASMDNIRIHHNVIYRNRASGVFFGLWGTDGPRTNIQIVHNTIFQNGSLKHWAGETGGIDLRSDNVQDVIIANNIVYDNAAFEIATFAPADQREALLQQKRITIANNLTGPLKDAITTGGMFPRGYAFHEAAAPVGDPLFANVKTGDFRLKPKSPAIGAAKPAVAISSPDIGACLPMTPLP